MPEKCLWCGARESTLKSIEITSGEKPETVSVCSDVCDSELREFQRYVEAHIVHFFVGLLLPWIVCGLMCYLMLGIDGGALATAVGFCGMGISIILYPFATPQTVELFGMKKSITIVRGTGVCIILIGISSYFLIRVFG